jgi:hypothetical protein
MEKEFVPYTEALELKQLGFDEPCFGYYHEDKSLTYTNIVSQNTNSFWKINNKIVSAPLYQQAFRWFRDKKLSDSCICRYQGRDDGGIYYYYCINNDFGVEETRYFKEGFYTYEEAELACLKKLIEIVKTK